jgi:hypothetical protein
MTLHSDFLYNLIGGAILHPPMESTTAPVRLNAHDTSHDSRSSRDHNK